MSYAFLYEPATLLNNEQTHNCDDYEYILPQPKGFPSYLSSFYHPESTISKVVGGPQLLTCCGYHNVIPAHKFLATEGNYESLLCTNFFCKTCVFIPSSKKEKNIHKARRNKIIYIDCYCTISLLLVNPTNTANNLHSVLSLK